MKKTWLKRLIAVSLAFIAAGTGTETMLYAQGNSVNSGGGGGISGSGNNS